MFSDYIFGEQILTEGNCEQCGKFVPKFLNTHHIIPRWCNSKDIEENLMQVCKGCHVKLDNLFDNFIKFGSFDYSYWEDKEKSRKQSEKYYQAHKEELSQKRRERYRKKILDNPNYLKEYYQKRLKREPDFNKKKTKQQQTEHGKKLHRERNIRYRERKKLQGGG